MNKSTEKYYPLFDYMRITLAIAVAASHTGLLTWKYAGNLPVQIFFALSGWLIGGILLKSELTSLPRFYYNRAARIWIPYFAALGLMLIASALKDPITSKWIEIVIYQLTFVYDVFGTTQLARSAEMPLAGTGNHIWSISAEEKFYLFAPLIMLLLPFGRSIWLWIAIAAATLLSPFWIYFSAISFGVIAAIARERYGDWQLSGKNPLILLCSCVALTAAIYFSPDILYRIASPFIAICAVLAAARPGSATRLGMLLGGISYPMYLNHWIGLAIVHSATKRLSLDTGLFSQFSAIAIGFLISTILYILIDLRVKERRDDWYTPSRGYVLAVAGIALVAIGTIMAVFVYEAPIS